MSGLVVLAVVACSESREPSAGPPLECEDAVSRPPGNRGAVPANADHIFQPGDPVADVVAGMPVSSVFVFAPGTYEAVSVAPKAKWIREHLPPGAAPTTMTPPCRRLRTRNTMPVFIVIVLEDPATRVQHLQPEMVSLRDGINNTAQPWPG